MVADEIAELVSSNELLGSPAAMNAWADREGYLLFRDALDPVLVGHVGMAMTSELQRQGVAVEEETTPLWAGLGMESVDADALYKASNYESLVASDGLRELMEQVFCGPVNISRATNLRYQLPGDRVHDSPAHQDHFTVGPNADFKTFWIPLIDIDRGVGGLAIAAGSHRGGLLEHKKHDTAISYQMEGRQQPAVPLESVHGRWLTTDYRCGDVLVFESCTVHRGLPNRSRFIRLSLDVRAQPAATPAPWGWTKSVPEIKEHRRRSLMVSQEIGLTMEEFETLMIEMHWRGIEANPEAIRDLAAELF